MATRVVWSGRRALRADHQGARSARSALNPFTFHRVRPDESMTGKVYPTASHGRCQDIEVTIASVLVLLLFHFVIPQNSRHGTARATASRTRSSAFALRCFSLFNVPRPGASSTRHLHLAYHRARSLSSSRRGNAKGQVTL